MDSQTTENLKSKTSWSRLPYIILYAICFNVAEIVLVATAVIQFVSSLVTGAPLPKLQKFGTSLSTYLRELADFLTYAKKDKPFPVGNWPKERDIDDETSDTIIITPPETTA